jgi:hypothetical protein
MSITDGIKSAAPNTQPIYPRTPLAWKAKLTTQATGYSPSADPLLVPPVLLGVASDSGALLEHVSIVSTYIPPGAGGGSAGGGGVADPADGPLGLRTLGDEQSLRFYTRRFGDSDLLFEIEVNLSHSARWQVIRWGGFPILPDPQAAWRLAPGEELYVGLRVPAPGLIVTVRGGQYE